MYILERDRKSILKHLDACTIKHRFPRLPSKLKLFFHVNFIAILPDAGVFGWVWIECEAVWYGVRYKGWGGAGVWVGVPCNMLILEPNC